MVDKNNLIWYNVEIIFLLKLSENRLSYDLFFGLLVYDKLSGNMVYCLQRWRGLNGEKDITYYE